MRLLWSLPKAAPAILRHMAAYVELAAEDLERTQVELGARLVAGAIMGLCIFFAVLSACLVVLALTWDTPSRVTAIACMGGVFVVAAIIAALYRSKLIGAQARFLATVRREWNEDRVILERILSSDQD